LEEQRDCLVAENLEKWVYSSDPKQKSLVIGTLRECLAKVCLEFIHPHLIIMDEFQRFATTMKNFSDPTKLEHELIRKERAKILILSATPYKMYTTYDDEEDHYNDFYETLTFLFNSKIDSPKISAIRSKLETFRKQLTSGEPNENKESSLRELKTGIEADLKKVMCRTERYWYIEETNKGILEVPAGGEPQKRLTPRMTELREYVQLTKFLPENLGRQYSSCAIDFWKSCPSILSFMDSGYKFIKSITDLKIPESLLLDRKHLEKTFHHNLKLRLFLEKVLQGKVEEPVEYDPAFSHKTLWKHLWISPTYQYYSDANDLTSGGGPYKFLVFSHWRFVPRALASILSRQIELMIRHYDSERKGPLKFSEKISLFPFDVCFPSLRLAREIQPLQLAVENSTPPTLKNLIQSAKAKIRKLLDSSGIKIGPESPSTWQVIARLEAQAPDLDQVHEAVERSSVWSEEGEFYDRHKEKYLGYLDDKDKKLTVSKGQIERLTRIALFSPANCILRSALSTLRNKDGSLPIKEIFRKAIDLSVNELRKYFNRPIVQAIINQVASGNHYNDRVLDYCQKGHYQEMMDEYFYLLIRVLQKSQITSEANKKQPTEVSSFDHLAGVLGTHAGATSINERAKSGHMDEGAYRQTTHFALPFGESETDLEEGTKRRRGTSVQDAFNSPFWPFVLTTTSRGQEGLDFHLYCRDVVHWNLPSNPVDLEQREGRINRYDGLCIRQNIRRDYQLSDIKWSAGKSLTDTFVPNMWDSLFSNIENDRQFFSQHFKHGLFPHWIYVPKLPANENIMIRRHLLFYYGSRDLANYQRLKKDLGLYRLAFGQPRQQDMIDEIKAKMDSKGQSWDSSLEYLMINLSPISQEEVWQDSLAEAKKILLDPSRTSQLLKSVREICQMKTDCLKVAWKEINDFVKYIIKIGAPPPESQAQKAEEIVAALLYLINPYDSIYDRFPRIGFADDIEKIKLVHRKTI
jgi:hypothetical protein